MANKKLSKLIPMKHTPWLFQSKRLGFRNWMPADVAKMAKINADPAVMEFFPGIQTKTETQEFIYRMQKHFAEKGFCYYAVDELECNSFIGFIGLCVQNFEADFTPCVDIGWRLKRHVWNRGLATEGAKRCIAYAFEILHLTKIYSFTPQINIKSERIMQKVSMVKVGIFDHPLLKDYPRLKKCALYEKNYIKI